MTLQLTEVVGLGAIITTVALFGGTNLVLMVRSVARARADAAIIAAELGGRITTLSEHVRGTNGRVGKVEVEVDELQADAREFFAELRHFAQLNERLLELTNTMRAERGLGPVGGEHKAG